MKKQHPTFPRQTLLFHKLMFSAFSPAETGFTVLSFRSFRNNFLFRFLPSQEAITRRSGVFFKLVSDSDTRFKNICLELLVIGFSIAGGSGQFY
ncbi:MAG: hypothetical protein V3U87_12670 [Methylococcaceae bacterium]